MGFFPGSFDPACFSSSSSSPLSLTFRSLLKSGQLMPESALNFFLQSARHAHIGHNDLSLMNPLIKGIGKIVNVI